MLNRPSTARQKCDFEERHKGPNDGDQDDISPAISLEAAICVKLDRGNYHNNSWRARLGGGCQATLTGVARRAFPGASRPKARHLCRRRPLVSHSPFTLRLHLRPRPHRLSSSLPRSTRFTRPSCTCGNIQGENMASLTSAHSPNHAPQHNFKLTPPTYDISLSSDPANAAKSRRKRTRYDTLRDILLPHAHSQIVHGTMPSWKRHTCGIPSQTSQREPSS